MDDIPNPMPSGKIRSKQFEQNAESIFILPGLELRFQTLQLNGKISNKINFINKKILFRRSIL